MGNTPNSIDFDTKTLADFLNDAIGDGTYDDLLTVLKFDAPGEDAEATDIDEAAGQLWANLFDDYLRATYPSHYKGQKFWGVPDGAARDALGTDDGLVVKDVAWVKSLNSLWYVVSVDGASASTWAEILGSGSSTAAPGPRWFFDAGTADADPGAGKWRFNNAAQNAATFIYINNDCFDAVALLKIVGELRLNDGLYIQEEGSPISNKSFGVIAPGASLGAGYVKIPIAIYSGTQGADFIPGEKQRFDFLSMVPALAQVLSRGNETGGTHIIVTPGDAVDGEQDLNLTAGDAAPASGLQGHSVQMQPGDGDGVGTGGDIAGKSGFGGLTSGKGGDVLWEGGDANANNDPGGDVILAGGTPHGTGAYGKNILRSHGDDGNPAATFEVTGTNGEIFDVHSGDQDPIGNTVGVPGSLYVRVQQASSEIYQHKGVSPNNTDWVLIATTAAGPTAPGPRWEFNDSLVDADPGAGKWRLNNATQNSATFIYINYDCFDGAAMDKVLASLGETDVLYIQQEDNPTRNKSFRLTGPAVDASTYVKIPIAIATGSQGADFVGGSGGTQRFSFVTVSGLAATLLRQNNTGGTDIDVDDGDDINVTGITSRIASDGGTVRLETSGADTVTAFWFRSLGTNGEIAGFNVGDRTPVGNVSLSNGSYYVRRDGGVSGFYFNYGPATSSATLTNIAFQPGQFIFTSEDNIAAADDVFPWQFIAADTFIGIEVRVDIKTASGSDLSIDVRVDGVSVFTSGFVTITAAALTATKATKLAENAKNGKITVNIEAGSGVDWDGLTVAFRGRSIMR